MDFSGVIDPAPEWADVPQMTTEAILMGGSGGAMNGHALALAKRTKYLKAITESIADPSDPNKGASLVGYAGRQLSATLDELHLSVKKFGALGNGSDATAAFLAAAAAAMAGNGLVHVPAGVYVLGINTLFDALADITFVGDGMGRSIIKLPGGGNVYFKGPTNLAFEDIGFKGAGQNGVYQSIWVTGFNGIRFSRCRFSDFGGQNTNIAGSCAIVLGAVDIANAVDAAGDSKNASIHDCEFIGNSRMTNFGVRVHTNWAVVGTAQCRDVRITDTHFEGFNWNAIEVAGPNTCNVIVDGCTAYACGISPFDLDKGAHDCVFSNLTIDRLLGNIDTSVNPNTRACVVNIQGETASRNHAYNNIVSNVTARLLASDIGAYSGYGVTAVAVSYAKNCIVRNVSVQCDVVPNRINVNSPFALAAVSFATISGCSISNVVTTNATAGIIETESRDASIGYDWCIFEDIRNIGTITGHAISSIYGGSAYFRYRFRRINFASTLSDCMPVGADKALLKLTSTATGVAAMVFEQCGFYTATAGSWGVQFGTPRLSFNDVNMDIPTQANWFKSGGSGAYLHFGSNGFQGAAVDVSTIFANLTATCVVFQGYLREDVGNGHYGLAATYGSQAVWHSTAAPTNPPIAYFSSGAKVNYFAPVAGGFSGFVSTPTGWKTYGLISA